MKSPQFIEQLRKRLSHSLPGPNVQYEMASIQRLKEMHPDSAVPKDAKVACVLNLLHFDEDRWKTVLIKRTENPLDRHSGQVSFPGGRFEPEDTSLEQVALREAQEEIGVDPNTIELIGQLSSLYIPVSNFWVHHYIGVLDAAPVFYPQPGEVEHILRPHVHLFSDPAARKKKDITIYNGVTLKDVPYFEVEGKVVWGATAMMLNELAALL
jgi:8-oxo-dGTP pyrophosphatase MutT (NUDIX family)